ncbi:MAG: hypothetical protein KF828_08195 [Anaerolineales bacterium]|nr:hypothetical protein [Anaerolineales bacterium]
MQTFCSWPAVVGVLVFALRMGMPLAAVAVGKCYSSRVWLCYQERTPWLLVMVVPEVLVQQMLLHGGQKEAIPHSTGSPRLVAGQVCLTGKTVEPVGRAAVAAGPLRLAALVHPAAMEVMAPREQNGLLVVAAVAQPMAAMLQLLWPALAPMG